MLCLTSGSWGYKTVGCGSTYPGLDSLITHWINFKQQCTSSDKNILNVSCNIIHKAGHFETTLKQTHKCMQQTFLILLLGVFVGVLPAKRFGPCVTGLLPYKISSSIRRAFSRCCQQLGVLYSKTLITHKLQDSLTTLEHLFWFGWCKKAVFITIFCNLLTFTHYFLYNRKRYRVDS